MFKFDIILHKIIWFSANFRLKQRLYLWLIYFWTQLTWSYDLIIRPLFLLLKEVLYFWLKIKLRFCFRPNQRLINVYKHHLIRIWPYWLPLNRWLSSTWYFSFFPRFSSFFDKLFYLIEKGFPKQGSNPLYSFWVHSPHGVFLGVPPCHN